jgi:hypothetical protein
MSRPSQPALQFVKSHDCAKSTGAGVGENERVSLVCDSLMALPAWRRYTGTRLTASGAKNSRSNATLTDVL